MSRAIAMHVNGHQLALGGLLLYALDITLVLAVVVVPLLVPSP